MLARPITHHLDNLQRKRTEERSKGKHERKGNDHGASHVRHGNLRHVCNQTGTEVRRGDAGYEFGGQVDFPFFSNDFEDDCLKHDLAMGRGL